MVYTCMNSGGPRIEPCGTPVLMGKCFDLFSVELTKMKQWNKQAIQCINNYIKERKRTLKFCLVVSLISQFTLKLKTYMTH